jgi:hypothetical protein
MKNAKYRFTLLTTLSFIACACLFALSTWGQVKVDPSRQGQSQTQTKIGEKGVGDIRPDVRVKDKFDSLVERVDALEAENQELKKQLSATKLLVTGLDKGIADFKKKYDTHFHNYWVASIPITELANQKDKTLRVLVSPDQDIGLYKTMNATNP